MARQITSELVGHGSHGGALTQAHGLYGGHAPTGNGGAYRLYGGHAPTANGGAYRLGGRHHGKLPHAGGSVELPELGAHAGALAVYAADRRNEHPSRGASERLAEAARAYEDHDLETLFASVPGGN